VDNIAWDGLTIAVSVTVAAEPSTVWAVLTRFDAYPEWSRAISRIEGKPVPGSRLHAWLAQGTPFAREMEGQIVDVDQPLRLVWEGGVPGEFFGHHSFEIASNQLAGTCVTSSETFSGALAPAVVEEHRSTIEDEFSQFLMELKHRCEEPR
jgi:hypothetical protein